MCINHCVLTKAVLAACNFEPCFHDAVCGALSRYVRGSPPDAHSSTSEVSDGGAEASSSSPSSAAAAAAARDGSDRSDSRESRLRRDQDLLENRVNTLPLADQMPLWQRVQEANSEWLAHETALLRLGCDPHGLAVLRVFTVQVRSVCGCVCVFVRPRAPAVC